MNAQNRLDFFNEIIYASSGLYSWEIDINFNVLKTNCPYKEMISLLLGTPARIEFIKEYIAASYKPVLICDELSSEWLFVFEKQGQEISKIHILGPALNTEMSQNAINNKVASMQTDVESKLKIIKFANELPMIIQPTLFQYIYMLHYVVNGEKISTSEINFQTVSLTSPQKKSPHTDKNRNGTWETEQRIFDNIRTGNLDWHKDFDKGSLISRGVGIETEDALKKMKITAIVLATLSTRAAIQGGLSPDVAYTRGDYYIQCIDNASLLSHVGNLCFTLYEDFINLVHNNKTKDVQSKGIKACCDYIYAHIDEDLSIASLSEATGYKPYYFSRKFKEVTGKSVNDYIKSAKIEKAKSLLCTTDLSIQEISDSLGFCTRSFFSHTFLQFVGCSPTTYREENKV